MTAPQPQPSGPFTAAERSHWRQCLVDQRRTLLEDIAHLTSEASSLADGAESLGRATTTSCQNVAIEELTDEQRLLALVDQALAKIDGKGATPFGICEETGDIIERERLDLMPWTPLSSRGAHLRESRSGDPVDPL